MAGPVVAAKEVSFSYNGNKVLTEVNFTVESGDFVSVIGPNGGGKTTLAKLMLGLLLPDSGTIEIMGKAPAKVRTRMGYVPQYSNFDTQFPVSVLDVVLMGKMTGGIGFYSRTEKQEASMSLEYVGLGGFEKHSFAELSGGQRQRVLIARALAGSPDILLLDEPTASVDTSVEDKLKTLLDRLRTHLTILMITHDLGFVSEQINKVICVNREVRIHESKKVTPEMIESLYGSPVHFVDHTTHLGACKHD
jgi:zinc transport system ATP-binding protein